MIFSLCFKVDLMRFFRSAVITQPFRFALNGQTCTPFVLVPNDAHKTGFVSAVGFSHVLRIAIRKHISKICNSIVGFVAIDVVDKTSRPFTVRVQPRQPVCFVNAFCNADRYVTNAFFCATRNVSSFNRFAWANSPSKNARVGGIIKHFLDLFLSQRHLQSPVISMNTITAITKVQA